MTGKVIPIYRGRIISVAREQASLPDGRELMLEIVRHPGGAVISAVDDQRRVCLIRQYRHAAGGWIWELPAGVLDNEEPPRDAARRELREETGISAGQWAAMGSMLSSPGFCDERLHFFLATDLQQGAASPEENEFIEVHWLDLDRALRMAADGEIEDAKTVVGLFRADQHLERS